MTASTTKKTAARKAPAKKATKPAATKTAPADAAPSPAEIEATVDDTDAGTITFQLEVNGTEVDLELPASFEDADPDAIVYMEQELPTSAFKALIGEANWTNLKRLRWTARDFRAVVDQWKAEVGLGNG